MPKLLPVAVRVAAPAPCPEPVEPIGPIAVAVRLPDTLVVPKEREDRLFSITLPAVKLTVLNAVPALTMVTSPVPTLMFAEPVTLTLPLLFVTLRAESAVIVRSPRMLLWPKAIAPLTAPVVGPL